MMTTQDQDPELRAELQRITETSGFNQAADLAELAKQRPHSISLVVESSDDRHGYNCFMYALGLAVLPDPLLALARRHDAAFPSAEFVAGLVDRGLERISAEAAEEGDLVLYFDEHGHPTHAGTAQAPLVVSKWGTGHIWKHPVFEIPATYGVEVRFYRHISREDALRLFEDFAHDVAAGRSSSVEEPR